MLFLLVLHWVAGHNYLLFHTLVDLSRVVVLAGIFTLAWHTRHWAAHGFFTTIGVASAAIAVLELLHVLAYRGMGVFPGDDANLPTQLWIGFRYLEAGAFVIAAYSANRTPRATAMAYGFALAGLAIGVSIFTGHFPDSFLDGQGLTPFKIISEYVTIAVLVASMVLLLHHRERFDPDVLHLLLAAILFSALSSVAFTRYADVFGMANEVGHYFLFVSTYLLYRAILFTALVSPFQLLFRDLKRHERNLESLVVDRTAELKRTQTLNSAFVEHSPAAIFLTDREGRFTLANDACEALVGSEPRCLPGYRFHERMPEAVASVLERHDRRARLEKQPILVSEEISVAGEVRCFETIHFPLLDEHGDLLGSGGIATDVTEHRRIEARYGMMIRTSMDGVMVLDARGRILEVNDAAVSLTGYPRSELVALELTDIEAAQDANAIVEGLSRIVRHGQARYESRWQRRGGGLVDVEISINLLGTPPNHAFFCFVRDITERKLTSQKIERLAHYDTLTGLPNKVLFEELVTARLAKGAPHEVAAALVYLDLDNFKDINDSLGHAAGDALLRTIGTRLRDGIEGHDLLCRYGADEFLLLLTEVEEEEACRECLNRLRQVIGWPITVDGNELTVTASMGVALFARDARSFGALFRCADMAMYAAKYMGRNTYRFFEAAMLASAQERLDILSKLRGAVERNELRLSYQPQLDLASRRVVGVEALIRWHHPELGVVTPDRFIPLAEDSGLIIPIGEWVLQEACRQAMAWRSRGLPPLSVAVNLSAVQFRHGDLDELVDEILSTTGLPPEYLELELTESMLLHRQEGLLATLQRLKALGVNLAIDDFGTGYSNLGYLRHFAVNKLKIDQSFVRDLDRNPDSHSIVKAIVQMAHGLGLRVIAEGVEGEHLLAPLHALQCDEVQGYHFGRPMTPVDFEAYFADILSEAGEGR
ncbi:EAL domain-containing protein [Halomonas sp. C05BenzN]|uniref:bifunctional diguanylate cyclase/phosphodiesterase n=1 Tax=Halomonas sp. C05BenzN TaxID=3411041 RepID=UPI003B93D231